jgi:hypothetical protein
MISMISFFFFFFFGRGRVFYTIKVDGLETLSHVIFVPDLYVQEIIII